MLRKTQKALIEAVGVAQWVGSLSSMLKALSSSPTPHELSVVGKATISAESGGRRGRSSVSSLSTEGTQARRKLHVKGRRRNYIKEGRETVYLSQGWRAQFLIL